MPRFTVMEVAVEPPATVVSQHTVVAQAPRWSVLQLDADGGEMVSCDGICSRESGVRK